MEEDKHSVQRNLALLFSPDSEGPEMLIKNVSSLYPHLSPNLRISQLFVLTASDESQGVARRVSTV